MGLRRVRRMQRQVDMKTSRRKNGILKKKERARRDVRMVAILEQGKVPYIPSVMSWLSEGLDKKIKGPNTEKLASLRKELARFDSERPRPLPLTQTVRETGIESPERLSNLASARSIASLSS